MIRVMIETSLIDWDGKLATVLFFDKCNFMCPFCQNWELIQHPKNYPVIQWQDIAKMLRSKKEWIDGVVLTGGEPLVYKEEVFDVARKTKALSFLVKLDTNGAYPDTLRELIAEKLVDYVALDIKAPLDKTYSIAAGKEANIQDIMRSIEILKENNTDYEFRTTCVPGIIDSTAIESIGKVIQGAKLWVLQQYVPENAYQEKYRTMKKIPEADLRKLLDIASRYVVNVKLRGKTH
jgi:pyruvate formate lyase activating enzyme